MEQRVRSSDNGRLQAAGFHVSFMLQRLAIVKALFVTATTARCAKAVAFVQA